MLRSNRCRFKVFDKTGNSLCQHLYIELDYAPCERGSQVGNGPDRLMGAFEANLFAKSLSLSDEDEINTVSLILGITDRLLRGPNLLLSILTEAN